MANLLSRMRHRRGFGVHSPFAFRFVRDVIQAPRGCRYYSDYRLRQLLAPLPAKLRREYTMLFRLAARLKPHAIYMASGTDDRLDDALHLACSGIKCRHQLPKVSPENALIICDATHPETIITDWSLRHNILVVRNMKTNPALSDSIAGAMPGGWTFEDTGIAIFITNADEPLNRLNVKIL